MILKNAAANFFGLLVYPLLALLLVPYYIDQLGLDGYGLVGFVTALVALLNVFTKGFTAAFQREVARRLPTSDAPTLPSLLATFERGYGVLGAVVAIAVAALSGPIAVRWLGDSSDPDVVRWCLVLGGTRVAIAFVSAVYSAALMGAERQVGANAILSTQAVVTAVSGAALVWVWPSPVTFYANEVLHAIWAMAVLRRQARRTFAGGPGAFDRDELRRLWPLSAGLLWTNGIGLVITQLDRIILGGALSLQTLGVYTVAVSGSRLLTMAYSPFLAAVYPRMCQLAREDDAEPFERDIVRNAVVVLVICTSIGLPLALFAWEVLAVWTRKPEIATAGATVLGLYAAGNVCLGQASTFYQAQMARGQSVYGVWFNTIALGWFPAVLWMLVQRYGIVGAAMAWLLYAFAAWIFNAVVLLRRPGAAWAYVQRVAVVVALAAAFGLGSRVIGDLYLTTPAFRLLLAAGAAGLSLLAGYVVVFGFHLPQEFVMRRGLRPSVSRSV